MELFRGGLTQPQYFWSYFWSYGAHEAYLIFNQQKEENQNSPEIPEIAKLYIYIFFLIVPKRVHNPLFYTKIS